MKFNRPLFDLLSDAYQRDEPVSGEWLGEQLGVSRAAIWKQMANLKNLGIHIDAEEGVGYRLAHPYPLIDETRLSHALKWHYQVATQSTNTDVHTLNELPAAATTEVQTHGRGRRGKSWQARFAGSVLLSVKESMSLPMYQLGGLSLACGVEVVSVLNALGVAKGEDGLQLKWPNDIYYQGKKIAGLLIELSGEPEGPCDVVVGLGLNIHLEDTQDVDQAVASLSDIALSVPLDKTQLVSALAEALVDCIHQYQAQGFAAWKAQWEALHCWQGQRVHTLQGSPNIEGECKGVDEQGALLIQTEETIHPIFSGEVSLRASNL